VRIGREESEKHFMYNRENSSFGEPRGENLEEAKRRGRGRIHFL